MKKNLVIICSFILASCGGGGGTSAPSPTITLSAAPTLVLVNTTSTLTWSSTNSTACSAAWTNKTSTSGSEEVTISTAGDNAYSITCSGEGGSSTKSVTVEGYRNSDGVVVDGYISGAEVFIDEDGDWILDSNESSTTSDNDGKFTLKYSNGNLVSIGGTDLDSQNLLDNFLITQKLTGHTEFKAITPVTSIAAFMNEPSDVNAALGIDPAIDVSIFDPVANKGDGGVNDYLYEKGNQLTVIAYALQNIANNLNTTTETTQDYFQSMAEVIDAEYAETESRVNIETEAFVTKALDNVISKKTLTLDDANKVNTISALTSILPVIQVKANDANTIAIFNFATSTFQADAQAIASGSATSEVISSYQTDILNYVATDQNLVASELEPDINAIIDSVITDEDTSVDINVLNNDSYLTTSSITVDIDSPSDGTAYISNNIVTYSPDDNFFGTDSIAYNITQGNKTSSSSISLVINSVNDIPTFDNLLSTYRVDENQTAVTTISASDVEEEELTISLGGEDQSSFNLSDENVLTFNESPDYETKSEYELVISVTDDIDILDKNLSVKLNNLNDNIPLFTSESVFNADENQTAIGAVLATDADGDSLIYTISGADININNSSGLITFVSAPDYETTTSYNATVTVTDGLTLTTQDITVNVNNLNDNSPVFSSSSVFNADENQTAIGSVTATDADGDGLTYSISGEDLSITSNGVLTFVSAPDYETNTSFTATVTVTDGLTSTTQDITVNVNNLNDNSPIFSSPESFSIEENKSAIGTVIAADADIGSSITYSIDNSVTQNIEVAIEANANGSGNVYVISGVQKKSLVLEVGKTYSFAHSSEHPFRFSTTADGTHGGGTEYTTGVDTSTNGTTLITVTSETPANLYYYCSIHPGMGADSTSSSSTFPVISIASSGDLTFSPSPDFETMASFSAKVSASDGEVSTDQNIQVEIIDVDPEGPVFENASSLDVDENQTDIGNVSAVDPFGSVVTYSISGTDAESIDLDTSSGLLTFKSAPDYETKTSYSVLITAVGSIANSDQELTININNLNDNEPVLAASATFSADENQTAIGSIVATDADGDTLTYSVTGTELTLSTSGVLSFTSAPDYEETTSYTATVSVTDGLTSKDQSITVNVNNLNDNSPIFTSEATFSAAENQTAIGTAAATDADGDPLTFSISGTELAITSAGVLSFASTPDYETKTSYSATITSNDGLNDVTQDIVVSITDIDDVPPAITSSASFSADENQTAIGTVTVTDVDTLDTSSSFTFVVSGTELAIDSDGILSFASAPDYETKTSYTATVTASDGAGNSSTQSITVSITDIDDEAPVFTSSATFGVDENQTAIGTVTASDADNLDTSATISFTVSGDELVIDSNGVLTFNSAPDYETKTSYTTTITATDGAGNSSTQNVNVNVNNLNDNFPVFTSGATFSAAENQTAIGTVTGSDADGDSLSFTVSGSELAITSAGVLTFTSAPDYETKSSYTVTVSVTDGANSLTQDITVNVTDANDAPVFTSASTFTAIENQTAIGTATASDADGDALTFTVSGSELAITSAGVLTFTSAPDYETKTSYTATVTAIDGANPTTQNITVNIQNQPNVSGYSYTSRYTVMDSDIPNTDYLAYSSNDTVSAAQTLINPSIVTGFVGGSDPIDAFKVSTTSSMFVNLDVVDYVNNTKELRLKIYESNGDVRSFSYTSASVEENMTILLPSSGDYIIAVDDLNGSSKYILTLGQRYSDSSLEVSTDFIPDYIPGKFIGYKSELIKNVSRIGSSENNKKQIQEATIDLFELTGERFDNPGLKELTILPQAKIQLEQSSVPKKSLNSNVSGLAPLSQKQLDYLDDWSMLQELRSLKSDIIFDFNYESEISSFTRDPLYPYQWNIQRVNLEPALNAIGQDVKDVAVAVIDSGGPTPNSLAWNQSNLIDGGYDFYYGNSNSIDALALSNYTGEKISHGTHVSTTIAAKNNGESVNGYAVKALNINVFQSGGLTNTNLWGNAVLYAAGLTNSSGRVAPNTTPIKVINLSLGNRTQQPYPTSACAVIGDAIAQGITVVAAAGNEQEEIAGLVSYPAACPGVISVGATHSGGGITSYSQQNAYVDISAPGGDSSDRDGNGIPDHVLAFGNDAGDVMKAFSSGTSMASPQVAAAIALMYSVDSSMTPSRVDNMLAAGELSDDRGVSGRDDIFGYGELNVAKLIENVNEDISSSTTYAYSSASYLDFGSSSTQLTLDLNKVGDGTLSVSSYTADSPTGFSYNASAADSNGFGTYTILIDRTSIIDGEFSNTIYFNLSNGESVGVRIYYNVGTLRSRANIGKAYFGMYDASDDSLWGSFEATLDGVASFLASDVPAGNYYIITSTDNDNDNTICSAGELCEFYPKLSGSATYFTVGTSDLSDFEIFVQPRIKYGGIGAASLTSSSNQKIEKVYTRNESNKGSGQINITGLTQLPNEISESEFDSNSVVNKAFDPN
jgi:hypothetical protein